MPWPNEASSLPFASYLRMGASLRPAQEPLDPDEDPVREWRARR